MCRVTDTVGEGLSAAKLIYWWNWYVFLIHQGGTWQQMWSKKDFLPKGMWVNLELLSLLLSGVFCFPFCSPVEMILTSYLLLWRPTTKASPTIVSCDTWLWFWLLVFACGPLDCYEVLGGSVVCKAQKQVYCLSRSKYLFHHCFQSQDTELTEQYWFFQFYILTVSNQLIYPHALQVNLKWETLVALFMQSNFNGRDPSHSLVHTWKASPTSTEKLAYYSNSSTLLHKKPDKSIHQTLQEKQIVPG